MNTKGNSEDMPDRPEKQTHIFCIVRKEHNRHKIIQRTRKNRLT